MGSKIIKLLWWANILLALLTLGSYLAPYVHPSRSLILSVLGLGYPALLVANFLVLAFWLVIQCKKSWLAILILILGYSSCNRIITFNLHGDSDSSKTEIKVGCFNANFSKPIAFADEIKQREMEEKFEQYLSSHSDLDILAVQEHGWRTSGHIANSMQFPFVHRLSGLALAIYSKYPFADRGSVDLGSNVANSCLWADIAIGSDTIRIYNTHLESNRHDGVVPEVIEQEAPEDMSNSALLGIVGHYQKFSGERIAQAEMIQQHRKNSPYPSVVCGDMNDTPQTHAYRVARGDMQDAFVEGGRGIGSTFGEKIPALRIDHVFVDSQLKVLHLDISRNHFSDHYLQIAHLQF